MSTPNANRLIDEALSPSQQWKAGPLVKARDIKPVKARDIHDDVRRVQRSKINDSYAPDGGGVLLAPLGPLGWLYGILGHPLETKHGDFEYDILFVHLSAERGAKTVRQDEFVTDRVGDPSPPYDRIAAHMATISAFLRK